MLYSAGAPAPRVSVAASKHAGELRPPGAAALATPADERADERKETRTSAVIVPLGPYHPALAQPYALHLRLRGERIVAASAPRSGFGHRGLHDLLPGQPLADGLVLLERACPHAGQAYRLALCLAVERSARIDRPRAAQLIRVFFAELEMTQSALWTLGELARALHQPRLRAAALEQRERIYAAALAATGERVYWSVATPGGVREGIQFAATRELLPWLTEVVAVWRAATDPGGALSKAAARLMGQATAPQTASLGGGEGRVNVQSVQSVEMLEAIDDARRRAPYDGYRNITLDWSPLDGPDSVTLALAPDARHPTRAARRLVAQLKLSVDIMHVCAEALNERAPTARQATLKPGQGSADVQTAHGPAHLEVTLASDLTIAEARLQTPCAAALSAASDGLPGRLLAQAPTLLLGQGLCPSCADL